jgi:hypothetical protein
LQEPASNMQRRRHGQLAAIMIGSAVHCRILMRPGAFPNAEEGANDSDSESALGADECTVSTLDPEHSLRSERLTVPVTQQARDCCARRDSDPGPVTRRCITTEWEAARGQRRRAQVVTLSASEWPIDRAPPTASSSSGTRNSGSKSNLRGLWCRQRRAVRRLVERGR